MACNPFYYLNIPKEWWQFESDHPDAPKDVPCGAVMRQVLRFQGTRWMCFKTEEDFGCDNGEPHGPGGTFKWGWCPPDSEKACPRLNKSRMGPDICVDLVAAGLASEEDSADMIKWWKEWVDYDYSEGSTAEKNFSKLINKMVCTDGKFDQAKIQGALSKTPQWKKLEKQGLDVMKGAGFCDCDNPTNIPINYRFLDFSISSKLALEKIGQDLDKQNFMNDLRDPGGFN